jgi:tRNA G18 (ribose-2'-O)-methylase SpoU
MPVERIVDGADPRLAPYRDLRDAGLVERTGLFVAEGRPLVRRLLAAARFRAHSVLTTTAMLDGLRDVADGVPVYLVDEATIRSVVGFHFHRGCLALGERGVAGAVEALLGGRRLVALERVTNPDNVGAVFRNAAVLGADGVLLSPGCADPLYRKAVRVSMGGVLRVPFATVSGWPAGLARLRAHGFTIVALTPDGGVPLDAFCEARPSGKPVAILLGSEGDGLSTSARAEADVCVSIPMAAGDHSLNVAVACAIGLHRLAPA